jgi:hypothetical protein
MKTSRLGSMRPCPPPALADDAGTVLLARRNGFFEAGAFAANARLAESGRLVRRMSHRVDPAAIAEEARTVRLDAVLGLPDGPFRWGIVQRQTRTLTPLIMVRAFVVSSHGGIVFETSVR